MVNIGRKVELTKQDVDLAMTLARDKNLSWWERKIMHRRNQVIMGYLALARHQGAYEATAKDADLAIPPWPKKA